ncbi:unannotated protein [freshwater metagenome]|uniref:Unannotated protein n=1 Tax=freshwater metagenome TaxID=449393 RepID=A0A6J6PI52_9ZZZZ
MFRTRPRRLLTAAAVSVGLVLPIAVVPSAMTAGHHKAPILNLETLTGLQAEKMMEEGKLTSVELIQMFLDRIAALNKSGPGLNAVTQINPDALKEAALADKERADGKVLGPAHGLPILLKDIVDAPRCTPGSATTSTCRSSGSSASSLWPTRPADTALRLTRTVGPRLAGTVSHVNSDTWNARYAEKELVWTAQPNRFLVSETDGLMSGSVLDLACGEGRNAIWLTEQGWRATGVDFADIGIAKAREFAASRGVECKWLVADLTTYEPPKHEFDLVILFYLQLPQHELGPVVSRAANAVAAGGTFLLVAHDSRNLTEGHGGPKDASVLYTAEDVVPHLGELTVERAESVIRPVETDAGVRNAIDVIVRAKRTW